MRLEGRDFATYKREMLNGTELSEIEIMLGEGTGIEWMKEVYKKREELERTEESQD